jgi:Tol biopolymer transport system component
VPSSLDNGQRSPKKLLRSVVARLLGRRIRDSSSHRAVHFSTAQSASVGRARIVLTISASLVVAACSDGRGSGGAATQTRTTDGSRIAYYDQIRESTHLINVDGSGEETLLEGFATLSPDGSKMTYARSFAGNTDLYVANTDGTDEFRITESKAEEVGSVWSPDSARIAFVENRLDPSAESIEGDLYVAGLEGARTRIARHASFTSGSRPSWSPDGTKIAFVHFTPDTGAQIYVADATGAASPRPITTGKRGYFHPAWSPDGGQIAYLSGPNDSLYLMNPDGSRKTKVIGGYAGDAAWSPDGSRIAFVSPRGGVDRDVFIVNADGTDLRQLTENNAGEFSPTWSPDGTRLAFDREQPSGQWNVHVVQTDGSKPVDVTQGKGIKLVHAWLATAPST